MTILPSDTVPPKQTDTMCVPIAEAINSMRTRDTLQIMKLEKAKKDTLVSMLQASLSSRDSTIADLSRATLHAMKVISASDEEKKILKTERDAESSAKKYYQQQYKRQKTKTWLVGGGGTMIIAVLSSLLLKK